MTARPDILALDFDGVLCEGSREYFETSRRTYDRVWPHGPPIGDGDLDRFRRLRPVIESGWEMPLLLKAMADGIADSRLHGAWGEARDAILARTGMGEGSALVERLRQTVDEVRRAWIAQDAADWYGHHGTYCAIEELRSVVGQVEEVAVVTTKEGAFAREIAGHWGLTFSSIQGKESGSHKCENLRALIRDFGDRRGRRPLTWFVEDRLEALAHVTTHADLEDVGLFLAEWGYNTAETRLVAREGPRIRPLSLGRFRKGLDAWLERG